MSHHYLRFDDVHYRYPNGYEALCGVSFRITHGEKVALVGANGAGKSTLLLHTNGLLMPSQGGVVLGGIALTRRTLPLVRQSVMDEPTSNLDPRARRQIIDLIRRFSHTTLIATHDMEMVLDLCDRTIVMKEGRIVADGSTRHVFGDLALLEECGLEQPCELRMKRALKKEYAP